MQVDPEQLAAIPLLEGLDPFSLGTIAENSVKTYVRPGFRLVAEGESGFSFSMILSGSAEVRVAGETVATLGKGDVFGEMAIVSGRTRNADVVATSEMVLASMMVWDFRAMIDRHGEVRQRLEQLIAERSAG
ncbi:MAG TPA: cyclic nucleotide-binding domain-containing protein [Acidimicrobiia bacterium]